MQESLSILILEPEAPSRHFYRQRFSRHRLTMAPSKAAAENWLRRGEDLDVVIADRSWENGRGLGLLGRVFRRHPDIPLYFTRSPSAVAQNDDFDQSINTQFWKIPPPRGEWEKSTAEFIDMIDKLASADRMQLKLESVDFYAAYFGSSLEGTDWWEAWETETVDPCGIGDIAVDREHLWQSPGIQHVIAREAGLHKTIRTYLPDHIRNAFDDYRRLQQEYLMVAERMGYRLGAEHMRRWLKKRRLALESPS